VRCTHLFGNALKCFRIAGLAAGATAAGFVRERRITVVPIANMIATSGYQTRFFEFGIGQLIVSCCVVHPSADDACPRRKNSSICRKPRSIHAAAGAAAPSSGDVPGFVMVPPALMTAAQIAPMPRTTRSPTRRSARRFRCCVDLCDSLDRIFDGFAARSSWSPTTSA